MLKNKDWKKIDGEICRVISFTPLSSSGNNLLPYASVVLECNKLPMEITGFITHKVDFHNLSEAFRKRVADQEILILWSKKQLKSYAKVFSIFMPRLWVMICKKGAYKMITDINYMPELEGLDRWNTEKPIIDWKPKVMK
ncbi:MAG: hypothetical protein WCW03_02570 [Candidatus Paceibacterota bacterium]|jgi:hypothetical protein